MPRVLVLVVVIVVGVLVVLSRVGSGLSVLVHEIDMFGFLRRNGVGRALDNVTDSVKGGNVRAEAELPQLVGLKTRI
jgi:hypothetical protein